MRFDAILRLKLLLGAQLIYYIDDTLVVCWAKTVAEVESRVNQVPETLTTWIELAGLKLAAEETEAVLSTKHRKLIPSIFQQEEVEVRCLKYLGLWFDGKFSFRKHLGKLQPSEKANRKWGSQCADDESVIL